MRPYTNAKILSSIKQAIEILDEPIIPCFCTGYERCRCKENALIQQINDAYTILDDIMNPNAHRALEIEVSKVKDLQD